MGNQKMTREERLRAERDGLRKPLSCHRCRADMIGQPAVNGCCLACVKLIMHHQHRLISEPHIVTTEVRLTWRNRLRILFGYRPLVVTRTHLHPDTAQCKVETGIHLIRGQFDPQKQLAQK
jgi:hypothetical protein